MTKYVELSIEELHNELLIILKEFKAICDKYNLEYMLYAGTLLGAIRHNGFIPWDDNVDVIMPREDFEKFKDIARNCLSDKFFLQTPETDPDYKHLNIPLKLRMNATVYLEYEEDGTEEYNTGIYLNVYAFDNKPRGTVNYILQKMYKYTLLREPKLAYENRGFLKFKNLVYRLAHKFMKKVSISTRRNIERFLRTRPAYRDIFWLGIDNSSSFSFMDSSVYPLGEIRFEDAIFKCPGDTNKYLTALYGTYRVVPDDHESHKHVKAVYKKNDIVIEVV